MVPFDENGYRACMDSTVRNWLDTKVESIDFKSSDGTPLRCYRAVPEKPLETVVFVHGFCEFFGKYHEICYDYYDRGYAVYFIELRGHGHSGRSVERADLVYVTDFDQYVEDVRSLLDRVVLPASGAAVGGADPRPVLFAHSMGGAVGALFLEKYPDAFKAAILSSPMLKMTFGGIPLWKIRLLVLWSKIARWTDRTIPGSEPWTGKPDFENGCALSKERYDYQFRLRCADPMCTMNCGSYSWVRAAISATKSLMAKADRVKVPVLICQAGKDTMVDITGQDDFASRAADVRIVRFPESKHEIFNANGSILEDYYAAMFGFLTGLSAQADV
jgi:lysophospholipase